MITDIKGLREYLDTNPNLSNIRSLIYWRICKVGSTSAIGALRALNAGQSVTLNVEKPLTSSKFHIGDQCYTSENDIEGCYHFAIVRNPYERFLSGFYFSKYDNNGLSQTFKKVFGDMSPEEFISLNYGDFPKGSRNIYTHALQPQVDFIPKKVTLDLVLDSKMVNPALPDITRLFNKIRRGNVKTPAPRNERKSPRGISKYKKDYEATPNLRKLVEEKFAIDFETFSFYDWTI
jgi:hypothetical protein